MSVEVDTSLVEATGVSIAAAEHLTDMDKGAVDALLKLARKIDAWDQIVEWALDDAASKEGARPAVPQNDNVSISAYLKYCDQLGLSPAGRKALELRRAGRVRRRRSSPHSESAATSAADRRLRPWGCARCPDANRRRSRETGATSTTCAGGITATRSRAVRSRRSGES